MKEQIVTKDSKSKRKVKTDWAKLSEMSEEEAYQNAKEDPDAQPTDAAFWENANVTFPQSKTPISLRLDTDLLNWLKSQGKGYQSRINQILRSYMEATQKQ